MNTLTDAGASVNRQNSQERRHYAEYAAGAALYRDGKLLTACANSTQRAGYRDARSGDEASRLVSTMTRQGMSRRTAIETVVG